MRTSEYSYHRLIVFAEVLLLLNSLVFCSCAVDEDDTLFDASARDTASDKEDKDSLTIRWWGQACFSLTTGAGVTVLTDPFPSDFGYAMPTVVPHVCLVSHDHFDHNAIDTVSGEPVVIRQAGEQQAEGITFRGIKTFHDDQQGEIRGENLVFVWEMAGIRLAHLGDLGHILTDQQVEQIGQIDVLMAPVGGNYSLDATQAIEVARQLKVKLFLPMHYKTAALEALPLPIATVDDFLEKAPADWIVEQSTSPSITISADDLLDSGTKAVVLAYE